jgi:hypothetical protein
MEALAPLAFAMLLADGATFAQERPPPGEPERAPGSHLIDPRAGRPFDSDPATKRVKKKARGCVIAPSRHTGGAV